MSSGGPSRSPERSRCDALSRDAKGRVSRGRGANYRKCVPFHCRHPVTVAGLQGSRRGNVCSLLEPHTRGELPCFFRKTATKGAFAVCRTTCCHAVATVGSVSALPYREVLTRLLGCTSQTRRCTHEMERS